MKRLLAVGASLIFLGLLAMPAIAEEQATVEISMIENGKVKAEKIRLTEKTLKKFENLLENLISSIRSAKSASETTKAIASFYGESQRLGLLRYFIFIRPLAYFRFIPCGTFVISKGYGYRLLPFKYSSIRIYKPLIIWHYTNNYKFGMVFPSETVMIKWLPFHVKVLRGFQFGFATNFIGIYIYIAKPLPKKSFTFFMGFARHAGGIEIPLQPFW